MDALKQARAMSSADYAGALIEIQDVGKIFDTENGRLTALAGASLTVREGEFVSLLGPSGCGKSTLLNIVAGLIPQTSGSVQLFGEPQTQPRRELGMMFQSPVLLRWRTVEENVRLPAEILTFETEEILKRVQSTIDLVGLRGFEHSYPRQLSGGMAQRVSLARLLVFDPTVLLMDEPFGALDEFTREMMNTELLRVWAATKKTVIFVTHNINEAVFLSDEIVVMSSRPGRIISVLRPDLPRPRTRALYLAPEFIRAVNEVRQTLGAEL